MEEITKLWTCENCDTPTINHETPVSCATCGYVKMRQGLPDIYENRATFMLHDLGLCSAPSEADTDAWLSQEENRTNYFDWLENPLSTPLSPLEEEEEVE